MAILEIYINNRVHLIKGRSQVVSTMHNFVYYLFFKKIIDLKVAYNMCFTDIYNYINPHQDTSLRPMFQDPTGPSSYTDR